MTEARRPRVLWVTSGLQPGGGERNIVSVMPHLARSGAEVALCTLTRRWDGPLAEEFSRTGLRRFDLGARRLADPVALTRLVRLIRGAGVDVVHSQDQDGNILAALAGWLCRVPVVMSRHVIVEPAPTRRSAVRARLVLASMARRAAAVVAVSEAVRTSLGDAGVPLERIRVVPNGILRSGFPARPDRGAARASLGWDARPVVLVPAVLRPGKGHEVMLEATQTVRERVPGTRVVLAGDGPLRGGLERAASAVEGVELLGHRDDVPLLMEACDVVVLPSFSEGLPTVLIEAALAGRPAVASRVGGAPEVVVDGVTGHLVPAGAPAALADAIVRVLADGAAADRMGARAREAADRFSLPRQAAALVDLYRGVRR